MFPTHFRKQQHDAHNGEPVSVARCRKRLVTVLEVNVRYGPIWLIQCFVCTFCENYPFSMRFIQMRNSFIWRSEWKLSELCRASFHRNGQTLCMQHIQLYELTKSLSCSSQWNTSHSLARPLCLATSHSICLWPRMRMITVVESMNSNQRQYKISFETIIIGLMVCYLNKLNLKWWQFDWQIKLVSRIT